MMIFFFFWMSHLFRIPTFLRAGLKVSVDLFSMKCSQLLEGKIIINSVKVYKTC